MCAVSRWDYLAAGVAAWRTASRAILRHAVCTPWTYPRASWLSRADSAIMLWVWARPWASTRAASSIMVCMRAAPSATLWRHIEVAAPKGAIIGAIIAVLAIKVIDHDTTRLPIYLKQIPTPIFAMAVIAYPLVYTLRIFIYRMVRGVSPFAADRNHIHHRLMDMKLGHRKTTLILYLYALVVIGLSLVTRKWHPNIGLMVLGTSAVALAMLPFVWPKRSE